jgi:hypothetical protein
MSAVKLSFRSGCCAATDDAKDMTNKSKSPKDVAKVPNGDFKRDSSISNCDLTI